MKQPRVVWSLMGGCALAFLVAAPAAEAGKVFQCTDAQGNLHFTDAGCPTSLQNQGAVADKQTQVAPRAGHSGVQRNAPEPSYQPPPGSAGNRYSVEEQLERVEARNDQVRQRQAQEYQRWQAEQGPGYWDRTAARNAMVGAEKPKNAAELAIQYNADSVAGGGRHQVRVPDVYETHIHYNNNNAPTNCQLLGRQVICH